MLIVNDLKFYLKRVKNKISRLKSEGELIKLLENYRQDIDLAKIEQIMQRKETNYQIAGMISSDDKFLFDGLNDVSYKHIYDEHPYFTMGIFILPKFCKMPIHDHRNMLVFTKLLCGRAEIKSYDKIKNFDLNENSFEVKLSENVIYNEGGVSILTPKNKNIHEITALDETAFLDIILPDYTDDNLCNYFKVSTKDDKIFMNKNYHI